MNINIRNGNVIDELKKIPSESVDCVVSSPPYYSLRDYSGVAMYSNENVDKVKDIASSDLQKHRDCVPYPQKGRYYLTEPVFNEKEKKWFISLKYDVSEIWGGNPECEHEWKEYSKKLHNGRGDAQNSALYSKQNNIPDAEISHNVCSKCGAWKGQLGSEPTYQMYGDHLMLVMKELKRVLKKTGTLFWNMGDTYSGSGGAGGDYNTGGIREGQPKYKQGKSEIPSKSLMMIPERLAMAMIDDGWILRNTLCWFKKNAMPASVSDRFSNKWEYVFFFTKSQKYYFDLDSIRKPLAESSIKRISQENIPNQFKSGKSSEFAETNPVNNIPKIMNNMHQKYQKEGAYQGSHSGYLNEDGSLRVNLNGANPGDVINTPTVRHKSWASNPGHKFSHERKYDPDADGGDFLDIPTKPHSFAHFAVMPETLIEPLIKAGCPLDGVVLDPFAGSGTVGVVGKKQGKNAILIEISPEYVEIIKNRLEIEASGINMNVKFVETASISSMEEEE
jgi:DNA modification methylase